MAERIVMLAAVGFACIYGIVQLRRGFSKKYFTVALCGMGALFFARLYYLIIVLTSGNDEVLTVGTLGQSSAYLFFATANISFLSEEIAGKLKKICIPGVIGVVILAGLFAASAVKVGSISAYIGEILYVLSMGAAFYISADAISRCKKNEACKSTCSFNVCVCFLAALNAVNEFATAFTSETVLSVISWILIAMTSAVMIAMLPLLKRRLKE